MMELQLQPLQIHGNISISPQLCIIKVRLSWCNMQMDEISETIIKEKYTMLFFYLMWHDIIIPIRNV